MAIRHAGSCEAAEEMSVCGLLTRALFLCSVLGAGVQRLSQLAYSYLTAEIGALLILRSYFAAPAFSPSCDDSLVWHWVGKSGYPAWCNAQN